MRSQNAPDVTQHIPHAFGLRVLARLSVSSAWGFAVVSAVLLNAAVPGSLMAQPNTVKADPSPTGQPGQVDLQSSVAQASTPAVQEQPGPRNKVEETAKKKGKPSVYGTVTKPGFFALVEQTSAWVFPRTGAAWGTGAARGSTFVGFGVSGNIKGSKDNLLSWSAQLGPQFVHDYNVPGADQTPLRMDVSAFLSPLRGDDLNIYAIWRGVAGTDPMSPISAVLPIQSGPGLFIRLLRVASFPMRLRKSTYRSVVSMPECSQLGFSRPLDSSDRWKHRPI